jgi:acyl-homoserine-lactone acylase
MLLLARAALGQAPSQLWTEATIYRDNWGVPHVYAENPHALAFAFGYAQAEDRLETIMRAYRLVTGRAAAVFGPDYAESDAFALKLGHSDLAVHALESASPLTLDLCEGFALGINAWIADHPARVPDWADGARPADVLALMHCYLMSFAPFDLPELFHRPAPAYSGNAWALAPSRTLSGAAVLVLNPHGYYDGPFQWYEAHLAGPQVNVAGATLCGLPVILQGHNEVLGWALTPNYPDFADIYTMPEGEIRLPPGDPNRMQLQAKLERLLIGRQVMESRVYFVGTPSGMRQRSVPFRLTARGPVVGEIGSEPCTFMAGGYADFETLDQMMAMAAARNLGEFRNALGMRQLPCFHVVYADRAGNLFYLYNAKVGDKTLPPALARGPELEPGSGEGPLGPHAAPYVWDAPVPANNPQFAWGELVPLGALPTIVNPPAGFIQACGTPPWGATLNSGIAPASIPLWLANERDTFRAQRARHLLSMGSRSFHEAQAMVYDVLVPFATAAVPQLIQWADAREHFYETAHPDTAHGADILRSWNFVAETGSAGMTLFNAWWAAYRQLAGPHLPDVILYQEFVSKPPHVERLALEALSNAAREMRNVHDALDVPWGDVHRMRKGPQEAPVAGGEAGEPLMVMGDYGIARRKLLPNYGFAYAMAIQFGDTPESVSILPGGISDDPSSRHFADQLKLFSERRFKVNYFLDKDVQRYAERAFGRRPTLRPVGMQGVFGIEARDPVSIHLECSPNAPAPMPDGMAPFTIFVTPVLDSVHAAVTIDAAIYVPPSVVETAGLQRLAVCFLDPAHGWFPAPEQQVNPETRIFRARLEGTPTCAVLGPASLRARLESPPAAPARAEEASPAPVQETPAEPASALVETDEPEAPDAPPAESEPPAPPPLAPAASAAPGVPDGALRSGLAWGKSLEIAIPGGAGTVRLQASDSLGAFVSASTEPPAPVPEGLSPITPFAGVHCSDPAVSVTLQLELTVPGITAANASEVELLAYRAESGWQALSDQHFNAEAGAMMGSDDQSGVYAAFARGAASAMPPAEIQTQEMPSAAPVEIAPALPAAVPTEKAAQDHAAAEPASESRKPALAWGKTLELMSENHSAEFRLEADASIGAFTKVLSEPPATLPEGLQAYGACVALSLSKRDVPVRITVTLHVGSEIPQGLDPASLVLYAHEADTGWARLEGQKFDPAARTVSAPDHQPRTYALLGPKGS